MQHSLRQHWEGVFCRLENNNFSQLKEGVRGCLGHMVKAVGNCFVPVVLLCILVVSEESIDCVSVFSSCGRKVSFVVEGTRRAVLVEAVDSSGVVYVCDTGNDRVQYPSPIQCCSKLMFR
jgi:hypothetical protein